MYPGVLTGDSPAAMRDDAIRRILVPLAATPVRLCLLEQRLLVPGAVEFGMEKSKCCPDCGDHHEEPCCVDLEDLPDAPAPSFPEGLPAIAAIDLPAPVFVLPPVVLEGDSCFEATAPIRGPKSQVCVKSPKAT